MPTNRITRRRGGAALSLMLTAGLVATGSARAEGDDSDMAGAESGEPTVLTVGWFGGEGSESARIADRFAEEVDAASDGSLRVDITYDDLDAAANWQGGAYDLLLAPTRQLDTIGVDTFVPLTLPFVVEEDDQADRVAASPVIDTMEAGLSAIDATGLIVVPVWQRHLAVVGDEPLRSLDQLHSGLRRTPDGNALDQVYEALGATPMWLDGGDWDAARANGTALAYETSTPRVIVGESTMAANFTIYYEFTALIAHDDALAGLDDGQRAIIESAAATAQQRSIDERPRETDMFRDACLQGAELSAMPAPLIADIGRAIDDTILSIIEDDAMRDIYDAVKRAAGSSARTWPQECHDGEVVPYEPAFPGEPPTEFPAGTYRSVGRTLDELYVSGVSSSSLSNGNANEYTEYVFDGSTVTVDFHLRDGSVNSCSSTYTVDEPGWITLTEGPEGCVGGRQMFWVNDDGSIGGEPEPVDDPGVNNIIFDASAILGPMVPVS